MTFFTLKFVYETFEKMCFFEKEDVLYVVNENFDNNQELGASPPKPHFYSNINSYSEYSFFTFHESPSGDPSSEDFFLLKIF